jgi:hypothetical protein
MLFLLLISVAFVAGGMWMIREGEKMGWLCMGFFGLGIPVFLLQLFPKASFLTVNEEGIEFCALFRSHRLRWSDMSEFGVCRISHLVGFNYSAHYQRFPKARAFAKAIAGFEGALPNTYGFKADELAQLLSTYHCQKAQT